MSGFSWPSASEPINRELCQLLAYLKSPVVIPRSLDLLARARTQEDQIHYAFVLRLLSWLSGSGDEAASPSLAASLAREFMLEHGQIVTQLQLVVPDQRDHLAEGYLPAFERTVSALAQWLGKNA